MDPTAKGQEAPPYLRDDIFRESVPWVDDCHVDLVNGQRLWLQPGAMGRG